MQEAAASRSPDAVANGGSIWRRVRRSANTSSFRCSRCCVAALFSCFLLAVGKSPVDFYRARVAGWFRHRFLVSEHAAARSAADPHRAGHGHPGAHRPDHDRRRGRAGDRRFRRRSYRAPADRPRAADRALPVMASGGHRGWRPLGRVRGLPASRARRQRDDLLAAADLYRHRHHELLCRGRAARPGPNKPSTFPIGDAYMIGAIPGTDVHWGLAAGIVLAIALYS